MSKLRQAIGAASSARQQGGLGGGLDAPPTGDLRPYVIFTQLKEGGPHIYAGWLDAADDAMAIIFAKEHYGRDQECVSIRAVRREHVEGLSVLRERRAEGSRAFFAVFTQRKAGDVHISAGSVEAENAGEAIEKARQTLRQAKSAHNVWAVAESDVISTEPGDVIWRMTDQSYRLARGYSRAVREKWATIRAEQDLAEYEKDDLTEAF